MLTKKILADKCDTNDLYDAINIRFYPKKFVCQKMWEL